MKNLQAMDNMAHCDVLFNIALVPSWLNTYKMSWEDAIASLNVCGCQAIQRTTLDDHNFVLFISDRIQFSESYSHNQY